MEPNGHSVQHGPTNGAASRTQNGPNGHGNQNDGGRRSIQRVLTVDEALPYTPLTSVHPFYSGFIPRPSTGLQSSQSIHSTPSEREAGFQALDVLDHEVQYNSTSDQLQSKLNRMKELLDPANLPQYQLKIAPNPNLTSNEIPNIQLGPFATMVHNVNEVRFYYPSPPRKSTPTHIKKPPTPKAQKKTKTNPNYSPNELAYNANSTITADTSKAFVHDNNSSIRVEIPAKRLSQEATPKQVITPKATLIAKPGSSIQVVIPKRVTQSSQGEEISTPLQSKVLPLQVPQVAVTKSQSHTPTKSPSSVDGSVRLTASSEKLAVIIPEPSSTFRPEEYEVVPDSPETPIHLSRKRQQSEFDLDEDDTSRTVDQQEKADSAFRSLREYLGEIYEAEDQLNPENISSNPHFTTTNDSTTLNKISQSKVESLLQKVISAGRFSYAPLDDLLRLQKLCEGATKETEIMDVKIDGSMGETEVEAFLQQVPGAELGLQAARTSLRLMTGGREDKQLYSEDVIQSALNAFKNITENCIVPITEMRSSGNTALLFKLLSARKKSFADLLTQCRKLLTILATLVGTIDLSETVVNTLEFTTCQLIFVENAPTERDSILGVAKFDSLRFVAMDTLAQIFHSNPAQRQGIFSEVLTSLERLPVTKQSARQFKLPEGGNIQLVSALIMRLIQTSSSKFDDAKARRRNKALEALNDGEGENQPAKKLKQLKVSIVSERLAEENPKTAIEELRDVALPLVDSARKNANYVVNFIVDRALTSTKSGDTPFRNLLDLFVEDYINCLKSTDWPAAELMLRMFLYKMVQLAEGEKTPAPAKNTALDLLGLMGAAISELNSHVRKSAAAIEHGDDGLGGYLSKIAESSLEKQTRPSELISWPCGPFRSTLEYLDQRSDAQLKGATGFLMTSWASNLLSDFDKLEDDEFEQGRLEKEYGRLAYRLRNMVTDRKWLATEYTFDSVSAPNGRLAYSVTLLNSPFCSVFNRVLNILLGSMTSEQATVRSKSLKSINQILDTDPSIIDREPAVKPRILRCANDHSVLVRDSALGLIGKCITLRPALEIELLPSILQRLNDTAIGVRKRAMKLAKDVYLRNNNSEVRSQIAECLLHRVTDLDEGVQELARLTIEEVWMSPFYQPTTSDNVSAQFKLAMSDHAALMIKTLQRGSAVATVLEKVLHSILSDEAKYSTANFRVCKGLVAIMFEPVIDNTAADEATTNRGTDNLFTNNNKTTFRKALQILTIFSRSNAKLFTPDQVKLLQPYLSNVVNLDDISAFRSVVVIFRHVLPFMSKTQHEFLILVRSNILSIFSSFKAKSVIEESMACLWAISVTLDSFQHLTKFGAALLSKIKQVNLEDIDGLKKGSSGQDPVQTVCKMLMLVGIFGKNCNVDPQIERFRDIFKGWKGDSVSSLMCTIISPFAQPERPLEVRKAAIEAIGKVCQSWPKNFQSANISTIFKEVFQSNLPELESLILRSFKEFLLLEEKRSENGGVASGAKDPAAKLGVMGGGHGDGIAPAIAQAYLKDFIVPIALKTQDEHALLATEVIGSITRQGLVHPKVCGSALITLETSENPKIAELAFEEHRASHEKHETILEKEYMSAVKMAYEYQRDIVKDTHGAILNPFASKLHLMIEVLKISKVANRRKFYKKLCGEIDFDPAKKANEDLPHHLEFSQFIIENLAFFEYATMDELLFTINAMENVVAAAGTGIAHAIESEIFHIGLEQPPQAEEKGPIQPEQATIDSLRLTQLTASAMMLSNLWGARTYLRRQYGIKTSTQQGKSKGVSKDLNKTPTRAQGVTGDKFWDEVSSTMSAFSSEESMIAQCRSFVELLNVDQDFKLAAEADEDDGSGRLMTPVEDDEMGTPAPPSSGKGRKRKARSTPGGKKRRARSSSVSAPRGRGKPKGSGKRTSVDRSEEDAEDWD